LCRTAWSDGLTSPTAQELGNILLEASSVPSYPSNLYLAALSANVADDGTGGAEISTSGTGYARVAVARSASSWTFSSPATWSNTSALNFPTVTGSAYTVTQVALYDAATGGNCKATFSFNSPYTVNVGQRLTFAPGSLSFRFIPTAVSALQLRISWNAGDANTAGYKVHWGASSGNYTHVADAGTALTYVITGLTINQRVYAAVAAYNAQGTEGPLSAEIAYTP
jgi:hypothetical protein